MSRASIRSDEDIKAVERARRKNKEKGEQDILDIMK